MNKILISAMALVALITTVSAEIKPFIGIDIVNQKTAASITGLVTDGSYPYTIPYVNYSQQFSTSNNAPSFKVGLIDDNYRIYLNYSKPYDENVPYENEGYTGDTVNIFYESINLNMDGIYNIQKNAALYFGVHVGQGSLHLGKGSLTILGYENSGLEYGVQTGFIFNINKNFYAEAGVKYTKPSVSVPLIFSGNNSYYYPYSDYDFNGEFKVGSIVSTNVGINYKF